MSEERHGNEERYEKPADETSDVEGHKRTAANSDEQTDDVEAHRPRHPLANDEQSDDSSDDFEAHRRTAN